jgi:regulatory protein
MDTKRTRGARHDPTPGSAGDQLSDADAVEVARTICLRQLTAGPRSRTQLAQAMARRGVPDEAAAAVLERFTEVGLVDDAAFAQAWVEARHRGRGLGRRALAHELHARGIGPAESAAALDSLGAEQEEASARELVRRRLGATRGLDQVARVRRLGGMLARKGYPPGLALRVVREAIALDDVGGHLDGLVDGDLGVR